MTWQPIETMPKGEHFLAWCPYRAGEDMQKVKLLQALGLYTEPSGGRIVVAQRIPSKRRNYSKPHNVKDVNSPKGEQYVATHWMPLPEPPVDP